MKLITIAGPPSAGKTSAIISVIKELRRNEKRSGVVKFDCLSAQDAELYNENKIKIKTGLSGNLCPDHFFVSNIEAAFVWGIENRFDFLITESAGLCNRCSPHIKELLAVCVIDNLCGINTPKKIGPMLKLADVVVVTKGDIVSQAEREVFTFKIRQVNTKAQIIHLNGITGQGSFYLAKIFNDAKPTDQITNTTLRFTMPGALCSYCLGERKISKDKQIGISRLMEF